MSGLRLLPLSGNVASTAALNLRGPIAWLCLLLRCCRLGCMLRQHEVTLGKLVLLAGGTVTTAPDVMLGEITSGVLRISAKPCRCNTHEQR
jgi:hypothetical protein